MTRRPQFGPVLACVDGSLHTEGVCAAAAWLAARLDQRVEILHRPEAPGPDLATAASAEVSTRLIAAAAGRVLEAGGDLAAPRLGPWDFVDAAAAASRRAGLLVLGRRGRSSPAGSRRLGANIAVLLGRAECSIWLASPTAKPLRRALVLLDARHPSEAMTDLLARHPALDGLDCRAVSFGGLPPAGTRSGKAADHPHQALERFLRTTDCEVVVLPRAALLADPCRRDLEGLLTEADISVLTPARGRLTIRRF